MAGKHCFIDKTPRYWMVVDFIDALYPEAPQIVLLRNPYAVAASLKSTWDIRLLPESCPPTHSSYLADLVLGLPTLAGRRNHPNTQVIRYERLVAQPGEEIQRVVTALGYDPNGITSTIGTTDYLKSGSFGDRKILEKNTIDDRSVHAWQTELTIHEMQAVTDMIGAELLIELGYEQEFQRARQAGVIDRGDAVTQRHRQVFQTWWKLRGGRKAAINFGEPAQSGQQRSSEPQDKAESSPSASDSSVMQDAQLLAESGDEQALRLANTTTAELQRTLAVSEADRAARLNIIHEQNATIETLQSEIARLERALATSETDRAARLNIIHEQNATTATLEGKVARLEQALATSEADRAARLNIIHEQNATIATLQSELARLGQALATSETDRAARLDVIHKLEATLATLQAEKAQLQQALAASDADLAARLAVIKEHETTIGEARTEIAKLDAMIIELNEVQTAMLGSRWWRVGAQLRLAPIDQLRQFEDAMHTLKTKHDSQTSRGFDRQ
jgi:ribosomal protein S20